MVRGPSFDANGVKKGAWSEEEDQKLISYIHTHGHPNWRQLPKLAGLARCGKSCRLRWMNYLRPNLKRGNYTPQEEEIILKLHEQHGNKWSLIAEKLPGRTDNHIKNHWHSQLKRRSRERGMSDSDSETKGKKTGRNNNATHQDSEYDVVKVVKELNNILESSSVVDCWTETTSSSQAEQGRSASLPCVDTETESSSSKDSPEEEYNSVAWWEINKFQEFSGDFWSEPFISEDIYSEYWYPDIGGMHAFII